MDIMIITVNRERLNLKKDVFSFRVLQKKTVIGLWKMLNRPTVFNIVIGTQTYT